MLLHLDQLAVQKGPGEGPMPLCRCAADSHHLGDLLERAARVVTKRDEPCLLGKPALELLESFVDREQGVRTCVVCGKGGVELEPLTPFLLARVGSTRPVP